jgi:DNA-binding Lrp family transcriptional regulator
MAEQTPNFTAEEDKIIDRIGHNFSIEALTNAQAVMTQLDTDKELSQKISQIIEAIKRQTESVIYVLS